MNVNYNFRRIALLLRAGWIEHKKSCLLGAGAIFLVWMLILFIASASGNPGMHKEGFWYLGMFVSWLLFCRHAGRKIHRPKGIYFLLPAGNAEKYTALLLEGLAWLAGFQLVFWGALWIWKPFFPALLIPSLSQIVYPAGGGSNGSEAGIFFVGALWLFACMSFRKHALNILTGGMAAYLLLFIFAAWTVFKGDLFLSPLYPSSYLYDTVVFLASWYTPVMLFSALVVMYAAYLKLKEKEQR
jgi:hypothetical protein